MIASIEESGRILETAWENQDVPKLSPVRKRRMPARILINLDDEGSAHLPPNLIPSSMPTMKITRIS